MLIRLLVATVLMTAGLAGGPAAWWTAGGAAAWADSGHCAAMGDVAPDGCGAHAAGDGASPGADPEGCAMMAACTALPALPGSAAGVTATAAARGWGPIASDHPPRGHDAEPSLEPPIAGL